MIKFAYHLNRSTETLPEELDCVVGLQETLKLGAIGSPSDIAAVIALPLPKVLGSAVGVI